MKKITPALLVLIALGFQSACQKKAPPVEQKLFISGLIQVDPLLLKNLKD